MSTTIHHAHAITAASMPTILNTHTGLLTPGHSGTSTPHNEVDIDFIAAYGLPPSYADSTPTTPMGGEGESTPSPFFPLSPIVSNSSVSPLRARLSLPDDDTETLPDYKPPSLPAYEPSEPLLTYACHQSNRKLRTWMATTTTTPEGIPIDAPTYLVTGRSGPSLFSKKPDFTLSRLLSPEARRHSNASSTSHAGVSAAGAAVVAALRFVRHSETPWHPRVAVEHVRNPLNPSCYVLHAPRFQDFRVEVPGGRVLEWGMVYAPRVGLALLERGGRFDGRVWARFEYSCLGTSANKGQEMGKLDVYELRIRADGEAAGEESLDEVDMFEFILGSCEIVVQYWRNMGKHYNNSSRDGLAAIEREQMLTYADWGSTSFVRRPVGN